MSEWTDRMMKSAQGLLAGMLRGALDSSGPVEFYASPLEHDLAVAFNALRIAKYNGVHFALGHQGEAPETIAALMAELNEPGPIDTSCCVCITPQVSIGNYRVDFFVTYSKGLDGWGGFAVEIDGHEFHEKTKQQAARDKARDRYIQELGYRVFRYTGSEVYRNPFVVAEQVIEVAMATAYPSVNARVYMRAGMTDNAQEELARLQ